jgi:capsular exopolysaccharide synthesis family protein
VVHYDRAGAIAEEYRALRNTLLSHFREKRFCLLVTSAEPREGATVTCLNLALALAEDRDRRIVVLDCNLRRPQVAALLGTGTAPGAADVLRGAATLPDVTWGTCYPNLCAVPAGRADAHEVIPLLQRPTLDDLVAELRRRFDFVLLDSPPVRVVPDVGYLGRAAPQALLVVRLHKTPRRHVSQALALLHAANTTPLGLALTHLQ